MDKQSSGRINDVLRRINQLDLEPIAFKLVNPEPGKKGMSIEDVTETIGLYRQFLKIVAMYPNNSIVPTKQIDEAWHAHILDTAKYAEDCENTFGYFLHHFPYLGLRGDADVEAWQCAFTKTRELFAAHFGTDLPMNAMECGGGCSDGGSSCDYNIAADLILRNRPRLALIA